MLTSIDVKFILGSAPLGLFSPANILQIEGWRMDFASIREHASTAIFLWARAEIKNLLY